MSLRITFLIAGVFFAASLNAQSVTENVHFDYYQDASVNDFTNHFTAGYGLTQIETNGITGGCLTVPDSISWGNDNAVYCSRYKPQSGDTMTTSLNFRYDSATVKMSAYQRAMSIWLTPGSDFNHYIVSTVSPDKKIEILTYGWVNSPYPLLALHSNHWYNYQLRVIVTGVQQVSVKASVFDLGTSGTATPALVNSSSGTFNDDVFVADTSIRVSITGASYGGAKYLDDFQFHGPEGVTNCVNVATGITHPVASTGLSVYPSPAFNQITVKWNGSIVKGMEGSMFTVAGKKVLTFPITANETVLDLQTCPDGLYFIRCQSPAETITSQVVVIK